MKLKGEIIEVRNCGDTIEVTIQAKTGKAEWKPIERQISRVDNTISNRKAFYLGRQVSITIVPL